MTICALLLGAAVLRSAAARAAEVRDARPAVRQRVDRRHADALRGAAGADGGAAVGLGHAVHARRTSAGGRSLAIVASTRRLRPDLPAGAGRALATRPRGAGRRACRRRTTRRRARAAAGAGVDHRRPRRLHGVDGVQRRTIRRCSSAGSCSSSASSAPRRRIRAGSSCKAPLLVGFFLAGLVIHGGLQAWWIAPVLASLRETPLFVARDDPDGVQRQRADHLPVDARAQPERQHEDRGGGRRGDRRRPDGHRQRAEPGRPGAPGPVLRRRGARRSGCSSARCCRR